MNDFKFIELINNIFQVSLLCSIGIILIILLKKTVFKKYTQNFNYYIWLIILIRMLLPFKIPIYITKKNTPNISIISKSLYTQIINYNNLIFNKIIGFIWLIGFLIFLSYNLFCYINFRKKLKFLTHDISDDNIKEIFYRLTHEMNIKKDIKLKLCKYISTPLGIGIIKPYILLPKATYNNHEMEWVFKHELMHYKKYDLVYKSLLMFTVSIHWFNPFVYIMRKYINSECELSCDESILKNCDIKEKKFYANILINSIQINKNDAFKSNLSTGLQLNNNKTILKRRLIIMLNPKAKKRGIITLAIAAVIVSSSFLSFKSYAQNVNKPLPSKINSSTTESTINNNATKPKVNNDAKVLFQYTTQVNGEFIYNKK